MLTAIQLLGLSILGVGVVLIRLKSLDCIEEKLDKLLKELEKKEK